MLLKYYWNAVKIPLECHYNIIRMELQSHLDTSGMSVEYFGKLLECYGNAIRMPLECHGIAFQCHSNRIGM